MKHYTFFTRVDSGIQYSNSEFQFLVTAFLNDPHGWNARGYTFTFSAECPDILIRLSTPATIVKECGLPDDLSCAELRGNVVYLNSRRWKNGSTQSKLALDDYRAYMVLHEVGHILGFEHESCPCPSCKAPIMMQQTLGIGKCIPNTKITKHGK